VKSESKGKTVRKARTAGKKHADRRDWSELPEEVKIILEAEVERLTDELLCVAVRPGTKIRLQLAKYERDLLLNYGCISLGLTEQQIADLKSAQYPELRMTLGDWDLFHGYVAAEANHCTDEHKKARLDRLADGIYRILRRHRESST